VKAPFKPAFPLKSAGRPPKGASHCDGWKHLITILDHLATFGYEHLLEGLAILEAGKGRLPSLPAHSEQV
jgi:hypothetical protein